MISNLSRSERHSRRRLMVLAAPLVVVGMLQVSGCLRREVPPPDPGGAYLSTSGGARFDQSSDLFNSDGELIGYIADLSLVNMHRPDHTPQHVYATAGTQGVAHSQDGGVTWRMINQPLTLVTAIAELANGTILIAGSNADQEGIVMRSLDQTTSWQEMLVIPATKKIDSSFFEIIKPPKPPPIFVSSLAIDPFRPDQVYATTSTGDIIIGADSGKTWHKLTNIVGKRNAFSGRSDAPVRKVIPSPHVQDEILIVTTDGRLFRTDQTGESEALKVEPKASVVDATYILTFPDAILVGTHRGATVTTDRGDTWTELTLPISQAAPHKGITVRVSPTNSNRILISIDSVIYRSEDNGKNWNTHSLSLPGHIVTDISIDPSNAARVLLLTLPIKV